ncbi:MAG: TonB-dependent receptor [Bacteroidales bacterium]|nr:TonB-dependent receptor [Bacteroidales bacterium]
MRKIIFALFLFVLGTIKLSAQSQIKGNIIDSENKAPIAYANVSLNKINGTTSNSKGEFIFSNLKSGYYILSVSCVGYKLLQQEIILDNSEVKTIEIKLVASNCIVEEVVISATKTENFINQVPTRINLISPRQIKSIPAQSIDDLLANIPGINVNKSFGIYSHSSTVTMRGLNGEEQGRVLAMIDGIPINKSDGGSVNWNLLNPAQIDRIEVIKGPGSSLYGGNAMGGAINIITKKSSESFAGKASIDYGTYNTMRGQLNLNGRLNKSQDKSFYWNLNGFYRQSDGYITASEADQRANPYIVKSDLNELGAGAQLGYEFNKNNNVELNLLYYDDDRGAGEEVYQTQGNNREHDTYCARVKYSGNKNDLKWNLNLFYLNEDYKRTSEWIKTDYTYYKVLSKRIDLGFLSSVAYKFKQQTIIGGIDLKQGAVNARDVYYTSTDMVRNKGKMNTLGIFVQDEISLLNSKLKLVAGLRFDYANFFDGSFEIEDPTSETNFMIKYHKKKLETDNWNAFSPKMSIQYNFNTTHRVYINYARGFRPGVLDDMSRSGRIKGGFKVSNQHLQPEYLNNFEIGSDIKIQNKLRTSISAYYSIGNDFMYYVNTGDSIELSYGARPIIKASNISKVAIYGFEAEINYVLTPKIILNANYAYAHSQIKDYKPQDVNAPNLTNKYLTNVPNHSASLSASWQNKIVNTSLFIRYIGDQWVNDLNEYDEMVENDKYPDYTTLDLKLSKEIKTMFLNLSIQNIFDKTFYNNKGAVSPGRFITLELGVKF